MIHQIWIGPNRMPLQWMNWAKKNPKMGYSLWTDFEGFRYQDKIEKLIEERQIACATDIMRVEILYEHGGVYMDADSKCLIPIQDAPFINDDFFACRDYTGWIANGVIGCTPKHPIMKDYLDRMEELEDYWEFGARLLTKCLEGKDVTILPTCTFYPTDWKGNKAPIEGSIYAEQMWATTRGKYATTHLHS